MSNCKPAYYYRFVAGSAEFSRFGLDDRKAKRLLARWLRLVWPAYKAEFPGSIAHAINNGTMGPVPASIGRVWCEGWVIPNGMLTIESFELSPESIAEFIRVYDSPRFG